MSEVKTKKKTHAMVRPSRATKKKNQADLAKAEQGELKVAPTEPQKGGRPSSFTAEVRDKILMVVGSGNALSTAAQYSGISYQTLRRWLKRAEEEEEEGEYFTFAQALKQAQAKVAVESVALIRLAAQGGALIERVTTVTEHTAKNGKVTRVEKTVSRHAPPDWKAAAWWLERADPKQWGRQDRSTSTNFNCDLTVLTDAQFALFTHLIELDTDPAIAYATAVGQTQADAPEIWVN